MTQQLRTVRPKKLPAGMGWGVLAGPDAVAGEVVKVVTRKGKTWEATLTQQLGTSGIWATTETEAATGATRERLENRADRREEWAEGRHEKATEAFQASHDAVKDIPLGQPILVGHHSERSHRKALATAENKGFQGLEHHRTAERHEQAASTIRRQLRTSIYDDDEDAIEQLELKLETLEAERERAKAINTHARKGTLEQLEPPLSDKEKQTLSYARQWHGCKGFPPYVLQNLGGNITRTRQRIQRLKDAQAMLQSPQA